MPYLYRELNDPRRAHVRTGQVLKSVWQYGTYWFSINSRFLPYLYEVMV